MTREAPSALSSRTRFALLAAGACIVIGGIIAVGVTVSRQGAPAADATATPDATASTSGSTSAPTQREGAAPGDDSPGAGDAAPHDPDGALSEETVAEVESVVRSLVTEVLETAATIDPEAPGMSLGLLEGLASEAIRAEFEAEQLEFAAEGWTRQGEVAIDGVEVQSYTQTETGAVATVRACVDSSGLEIHRADGTAVASGPGTLRAWNIYDLQKAEGAWTVVARSFSDDPEC